MFDSTSVKLRLAISVGSNVLRALISFITGLLIARTLHPAGYGDLMFLLGSFVAIRALLDMGSSSAFFTFLSQRARGRRFYLAYFSWLALQFTATMMLLYLIIPDSLLQKIWLGHDRDIIMLAFAATFMQQQVWQMVGQVGESMRKTARVQLMNLSIALLYFVLILSLASYGRLSVEKILFILLFLYAGATVLAYSFIRDGAPAPSAEEPPLREILRDYWQYCKPLLLLALVGFAYDFADKWMLQKFGGSVQQGYFQIASQFGAVSLLATASILNVFWKEVADAWAKQDRARAEMLYRKVSRGLVMLGAIISGMLIPWSEQIVAVLLGEAYQNAWPVFAIMLLYPIHQSMGQIGGSTLFATGQTRQYMIVSISAMTASIPLSYIVLAPASTGWLSGMDMGALGLACKMVALGIVSVNLQAWLIARYGGWKYDWVYQSVGIPLMLSLGFAAKMFAASLWNVHGVSLVELITPVIIASLLYILAVAAVIWQQPWLIGSDRGEMEKVLGRLKGFLGFR